MKAIVQNAYGSMDVLKLEEIGTPAISENEVLVRVRAASVNAGDFFLMRGSPWPARFAVRFPKPKNHIPGWDVAGHVKAAGKKGDEV